MVTGKQIGAGKMEITVSFDVKLDDFLGEEVNFKKLSARALFGQQTDLAKFLEEHALERARQLDATRS